MKWSPTIKPVSHREYELVEAFSAHSIEVPAGFVSDGASIRLGIGLLTALAQAITTTPYAPRVIGPAIVHDYLYALKAEGPYGDDRAAVDDLFHRMLLENKEPSAELLHSAVVVAGGAYWRDDQNQQQYVEEVVERLQEYGV